MHKRFVSYALLIATTAAVLLVMVIQPREAALRKKKIDDNKRQFFLAQVCGPGSWGIPGCPPGPLLPSGSGGSSSSGGTSEKIESQSLDKLKLSGYAKTLRTEGLDPTIRAYTVSAGLLAFKSTEGKYGHQDLLSMYERVSELVYQALTKTPAPKTGQPIEDYIKEAAEYLKCLVETMSRFDQKTFGSEYLSNPEPNVAELAKELDACLPKEIIQSIQPVVAESKETAVAVVAETAPVPEPKPTSALQRVVQTFIMQLRNKFINIRDTAINPVPIKLSQQAQNENIKKIGDMIDFFGKAYDKLCEKLNLKCNPK